MKPASENESRTPSAKRGVGFQNTESQRTRSFRPRTVSVISVPLCFKSSRSEINEHGDVVTPGRNVVAEEVEDDGVLFAKKMEGLTRELATQFHESEGLQSAIRDDRLREAYEDTMGSTAGQWLMEV